MLIETILCYFRQTREKEEVRERDGKQDNEDKIERVRVNKKRRHWIHHVSIDYAKWSVCFLEFFSRSKHILDLG